MKEEAEGLSNIRFVGWTDRLSDYYSAMDLFLFPSRSEALGSAVLEAMSFGVPVVASDVGGIPEIVQPGVNGFLIDSTDVNAWAHRVERLCNDSCLRTRLAQNAEVTAAAFSPEAIAEQYYSLYVSTVYGTTWAWPDLSPPKTRSESF